MSENLNPVPEVAPVPPQGTRELHLKSGKVAVIITRMNGAQMLAIEYAKYVHMTVPISELTPDQLKDGKAKYDFMQAMKDEAKALLQVGVVMYDGSPDNIVDRLLEADASDLREINEELKKL